MTLQQQAVQAIEVLPESKLPTLIQFARFLNNSPDVVQGTSDSPIRRFGRLKGKIKMTDDFNETPAEFKEYM